MLITYYDTDVAEVDVETELIWLSICEHFQGYWANRFTVSETKNWPFYLNETTTIHVPMMSAKKKHFNYLDCPELEAQVSLHSKSKNLIVKNIIINTITTAVDHLLLGTSLQKTYSCLD